MAYTFHIRETPGLGGSRESQRLERHVHRNLLRIIIILMTGLCSASYSAEPSAQTEPFTPYRLVGGWSFVNSNTGTKYGGDAKVNIDSIGTSGLMHATVSYDGRQTNDICTTRGVFSDKPVEAEVEKTSQGYIVSFNIGCVKGQSPRLRSWTLTCNDGLCTEPEIEPWGKGMLTLKVQQ